MKKRLTIIAVLMMFCSTMFAQDKHFIFENADLYEQTMIATFSVKVNGELAGEDAHDDIEIAAFHNNVLRSYGTFLNEAPNGQYVASMSIYGNVKNEVISFKLWSPSLKKELSSEYTVKFANNKVIGSWYNPKEIAFYEPHWDYMGNPDVTMSVMSTIMIDGNPIMSENYQLAAFADGELRGVANPKSNIIYGETFYLSSLNVDGELVELTDEDGNTYYDAKAETISFKLWDYENEKEYVALNTLPFEADAVIGEYPDFFEINFLSFEPVAKIGDNNYPTLAAALADTIANDTTIIVLKDIKEAGLVINKDVTIDFNNNVYTLESGITINKEFTNGAANEVTFKNGTLNVAEASDVSYLVKNYADLTIDNMTFNGSENNSYVLSFVSGEVSIKNSTINAYDETHFAFQTCEEEAYSAPVVTLWHNSVDSVGNANSYSNKVIGMVEYTAGSIIGNTNDVLNVVAKKQFTQTDGTGTEGWGTISTPVYTENNFIAIPEYNTAAHDLYKYSEPTYNWYFYKGEISPFATFDLGQGYLYANAEKDYTFALEGKLANGKTVSFGISYTPETANSYAGFNFIGNPYLHQIAFGNFEAEDYTYTLAEGFYVVSENGTLVASMPNQTIKPMESVMLQLIPKETRSRNIKTILNIHPTAVESKRASESNGYLAINVSNDNYSDVAYIALGENEGLNKLGHYNTEAPMVYVPVDGANYAIATMSQDVTMVPVSFKAVTMGEYTIGVEAQNCEYSTMTLVDRFTGVETNLLVEDYSFIAKSNDNADRFFIRLDNSQQSTVNSHFAFISNGMLNIDVEGQAMINVYDVTGRSVAEYNVFESASISTSDFANGMYIIRMSDENGVKVQKVVIE